MSIHLQKTPFSQKGVLKQLCEDDQTSSSNYDSENDDMSSEDGKDSMIESEDSDERSNSENKDEDAITFT